MTLKHSAFVDVNILGYFVTGQFSVMYFTFLLVMYFTFWIKIEFNNQWNSAEDCRSSLRATEW